MLDQIIEYDKINFQGNSITALRALFNFARLDAFLSGVKFANTNIFSSNVNISGSETVLQEVINMQASMDYLIKKLDSMDDKFDKKLDSIKDDVHSIDKRLTIIETILKTSTDLKTKILWPMMLAIIGGLIVVFGQYFLK